MRHILATVRAAADRYDMIQNGDSIAVGVSGGKDSVLLLCAMCEIKRFYPQSFDIKAVTLDMCFGGENTDYTAITRLCEGYGISHTVIRTQLASIIFDIRREKNPCSLCARMRRGALHDAAKELGCNKIALGHHLDDAAQTVLMNLFSEGRVGCFAPVTYLSRKNITMIRPLIFTREREIENTVTRLALPVVKSVCPADKATTRESVGKLLEQLDSEYGGVTEKIVGALQRGGIDRW